MGTNIPLVFSVDEMIDMIQNEGKDMKYLADFCGVSVQTIKRRLDESGQKIRTKNTVRVIKCQDCGSNTETKAYNASVCGICKKKRNTARNVARYQQGFRTPSQTKVRALTLADGNCDICGNFGSLHRDHDHDCCPGRSTEACGLCFRGKLCVNCNLGIGQLRENQYILSQSISYIRKWKNNGDNNS